MENQNDGRQSQQGSGSAENTGRDRQEQLHRNKDLSGHDKQNIANEIGEKPADVSSLRETGQLSGRDDSSGGTGDQMESQNTGQATDR
jgi:hypothetical protein